MRVILLSIIILLLVSTASASNWRIHTAICNGNVGCMKEQAKAQNLWTGQAWDADLKDSCRKQYIQPYSKDYIGAVNCVYPLQVARQILYSTTGSDRTG